MIDYYQKLNFLSATFWNKNYFGIEAAGCNLSSKSHTPNIIFEHVIEKKGKLE